MSNRSTSVRAQEALARLQSEANVWVATASSDGVPHLVPLSLAWIDSQIVVATPFDTPTARNGAATGRARVALDGADDVVIFDVKVEVVDFDGADPALKESYVERVGWDPRNNPGHWSLLMLTPWRAQAWNSPSEISGRTIISDGQWLGQD